MSYQDAGASPPQDLSAYATTSAMNAAIATALAGATHPTFIANRWYAATLSTVNAGNAGQNTAQFSPFFLDRSVTISDLGAVVDVALAANNLQLAIYLADPAQNYNPNGVLAQTGNISVAATGAVSGDITGSNVVLPAGMYWAAVNHSGATSTILAVASAFTQSQWLYGASSIQGAATPTAGFRMTAAMTFGTWTASPSLSFVAGSNGPLLYMKAA